MIFFDIHMMADQQRELARDLRLIEGSEGWRYGDAASPKHVTCRQCGSYKGDACHPDRDGIWCEQRIKDNRKRLYDLPTYGYPVSTPCCKQVVYLIWRSPHDTLEWTGVPCAKCDKTYMYRLCASGTEVVEERVLVDKIHPQRVIMNCWGFAETMGNGSNAG